MPDADECFFTPSTHSTLVVDPVFHETTSVLTKSSTKSALEALMRYHSFERLFTAREELLVSALGWKAQSTNLIETCETLRPQLMIFAKVVYK